ncbi:MAG: hypothetical protein AAF220_07805, partial [Pseudomonadota bacterium]
MGVEQYGCTLFHTLDTPSQGVCDIATLADIFGKTFVPFMTRANKFESRSAVKRKYPGTGAAGKTYRWHEVKGLSLFERELLLLYKLRSSIVHGDRDPRSEFVQSLARSAYNALDDILSPVFK